MIPYNTDRHITGRQPNPACCVFLNNLWAKSDFVFKWLKKNHDMWKLCEIQVSVFINGLIGHQPCSFVYVLSMATFTLQRQGGVVANGAQNLEYFFCPLTGEENIAL